jgi:hypothetical protein
VYIKKKYIKKSDKATGYKVALKLIKKETIIQYKLEKDIISEIKT